MISRYNRQCLIDIFSSCQKGGKNIKIIWYLSILLVLVGFSGKVFADEMDYTVIPLFSENQVPETTSYFELILKPQTQETIHLEITNFLPEAKAFSLEVNEAITNSNGVLDYIRKIPQDTTLAYPMSELVSLPEQVEVGSQESLIVPITIDMPAAEFAGILLGGIVVKPVEPAEEAGPVVNHYTHTIAIVLNGEPLNQELELRLQNIEISQRNFRNVIYLDIQNPLSLIINDLEVNVEVRRAGEERVIYEQSKADMRMAPNSTMAFPVEIRDHFTSGDYEAQITLLAENQTWLFTENFTIEEAQAQEFNELTIDQKQGNRFWLKLLVASFVIISGTAYVGRKHLRRS